MIKNIITNYIIAGDGRLGWPNEAPYDAIHVGAASPELPKHVRL